MNTKIIPNFLGPYVNEAVKKTYGDNFYIKGNDIYRKAPPDKFYDIKVGFWFLKDSVLYMVNDNE